MPRQPQKPSAQLSSEKMRAALPRLESRIKELRELDPSGLTKGDDPVVEGLSARISSTLANIYGENTVEFERLREAAILDATSYYLAVNPFGDPTPTPVNEIREGVDRGRQRAIALLQGEVDSLKEALHYEVPPAPSQETAPTVASDEIFVVHGRDDRAKAEVARLIERAGLRCVILHEQPHEGKTIIEKFEKHGGAAGFAVVIATPDDLGGLSPDTLRPRARQNVIGEMFWFAGRLGRERVCALIQGDLEMPSDFAGVGYTAMDEHGAWKHKLLRELDAAGYKNLDWKNALA